MKTGITGVQTGTVTDSLTAEKIGSGTLDVLATPAVAALVEETCWKSVADQMEDGCCTVGIRLELSHLAPTPPGVEIRCETVLAGVEGRTLTFEAKVYDPCGCIAECIHKRVIVDAVRFQQKADRKR